MGINKDFWSRQSVLITGHTGFKGSWLSMMLSREGATVNGYALEPPTKPSLFEMASLAGLFSLDIRADIADLAQLKDTIRETKPTIIFHLAAQSLVLESYQDPVESYLTNAMGTVNLLEAARQAASLTAVVVVTTDKVYTSTGNNTAHTERDRLGGHDPYSGSKACTELITDSFRQSFFQENDSPGIATARAGNVIGGGDWADNRLLPDCYRAFSNKQPMVLRHAASVRPWQHVLEPLIGYLLLAQNLSQGNRQAATAWNFGPNENDELQVQQVAEIARQAWGSGSIELSNEASSPVETDILRLSSAKALTELHWHPRWPARQAIDQTMRWYRAVHDGADPRRISEQQIAEYLA